ncbi:hypothetical protein BJX64DRAFT_288545 [Aspergillus heterothallicus]
MATLRKNGQQPSCEPCRTSKLRCDHSKPVCQRCVARNRAGQCVYHPCPLTKPRDTRQRKEQARTKTQSSSTSQNPTSRRASTEIYEWVERAPSVIARGAALVQPRGEVLADYGVLAATLNSKNLGHGSEKTGSHVALLVCDGDAQTDPRDTEIGAQILALFEHLSFFAEIIELRFDLFDGYVYSPQLMRESLAVLKSSYEEVLRGPTDKNRPSRLLSWSQTIFQNTAREIETRPDMSLLEYVSIIAPRWDTIGLVFAILGTASFQISQTEAVLKRKEMPGGDKHGLRKIAIAASDMCLQFSQKLGAISDPLSWATIQRTVLLVQMHGYSDYRSWQSLGEVVGVTFALGLHHGKVDEQAPFFLSEIRCRTMVCAYALDKDSSTLLGRPPRICRKFCNLRLPMDLDWEHVVADAPVREAAIQRLGPDGWDTQEHTGHECSRPRATLLLYILREMILELSLSYTLDNLDDMIRHESHQMQMGLPECLQWSHGNSRTPVLAASVHLEFLWSELVLSQAIAKLTGQTPYSLIEASREILTVLLDAIGKQIRIGHVNSLLTCDLSYIGLPAAAALSKELLQRSQSAPLQTSELTPFPRSDIIQKLCVFAAHLEALLPERESDAATFQKGLQSIRSTLDAVLAQPSFGAQPNGTSMVQAPVDGVAPQIQGAHIPGDLQGLDFAAFWEEFGFDWEGDRRVLFS